MMVELSAEFLKYCVTYLVFLSGILQQVVSQRKERILHWCLVFSLEHNSFVT